MKSDKNNMSNKYLRLSHFRRLNPNYHLISSSSFKTIIDPSSIYKHLSTNVKMHLSAVALYLAAGLSVVKANFDIYYVESGLFIRNDFDMEGYQILRSDDEVDCKGDVNHPLWLGRWGDVSSTRGIRCEDEGPPHGHCLAMGEPHTPEKIEVMEMNLGHYHWSKTSAS